MQPVSFHSLQWATGVIGFASKRTVPLDDSASAKIYAELWRGIYAEAWGIIQACVKKDREQKAWRYE